MSRNLIINRLYSSKLKNDNLQQPQKNHKIPYDNHKHKHEHKHDQQNQLQQSTGTKSKKNLNFNFFNNNNNVNNLHQLKFQQQQYQQSTPSQLQIANPQNFYTFQKRNEKNLCKAFFDNFQTNCQVIYSKVRINQYNLKGTKNLQRKLEYELICLKEQEQRQQSQIINKKNRLSCSKSIITRNNIHNNERQNNQDNHFQYQHQYHQNHYQYNNKHQNQYPSPSVSNSSHNILNRQKGARQLRHSGISLVQLNQNKLSGNRNNNEYLQKKAYLNRNQNEQIQREYYKNEENLKNLNKKNLSYFNRQNSQSQNSLLLKNNSSYSILDIRKKYQRQNNQPYYPYSKSYINVDVNVVNTQEGYESIRIRNQIEIDNENMRKSNPFRTFRNNQSSVEVNENEEEVDDDSFPRLRSSFYFNDHLKLAKVKSLKTQPVNQESIKRAHQSRLAYYRRQRQRQLKLKQANSYNSRQKSGIRILTQRSLQNNQQLQLKRSNNHYSRNKFHFHSIELKFKENEKKLQQNHKDVLINQKNQLKQLIKNNQNSQNNQNKNQMIMQNPFSERYLSKSYQQNQEQKENNFNMNINRHNMLVENDKMILTRDKYLERESRQSQRLKSIRNQLNNIYQANQVNNKGYYYPLKENKQKLVIQKKGRTNLNNQNNVMTKQDRPTLKKVGSIIRF